MKSNNPKLGIKKQKYYQNKLNIISELIQKIYNILIIDKKYISEFASDFKDLQDDFEPKYLQYINIKRFAVPIIGRVNAGKSTFLNFLLGLKDILQTDTKITTRFVCIIRYNEEAEKPKAYNVIFEERKLKYEIIEKSNYQIKYNFEKGDEITGKDIHEIIKERNEKIANNKSFQLKNEDYFMIIEFKIPIFNKEKLIEYSEVFEFMDLPGLNEYDGEKNFFITNILPIITQNVKFSLFIFDCSNLKDEDTLDLYKNYIFHLGKNYQNNFYIINKIDLSENEDEEEKNFKNFINENCKIIEKENYFVGTNSLLLSLENEKYNNFNSYLNYKEIEIKNEIEHEPDFVYYLKDEMKKDFGLEVLNKTINNPRKNKNEKEIEQFLDEFNKKIQHKNFRGILNIDDYLYFKNIFSNYNMKGEKNSKTALFFFKNLLNSFKKSLDAFFDLEKYKISLEKIMKELSLSPNNFYKILEIIKSKNDYKYSMKKIKEIKPIIEKLKELEPDNDFIKYIILEFNNLEEFINKDRKIRIAFLGLYSSGKSTIINLVLYNSGISLL